MSNRHLAAAEVMIVNDKGLHVRAATVFAQTACGFADTEVTVELGSERANGKSVMNLLLLTAAKGTVVTVRVDGPQEQATEALAALREVVERGFYEKTGGAAT